MKQTLIITAYNTEDKTRITLNHVMLILTENNVIAIQLSEGQKVHMLQTSEQHAEIITTEYIHIVKIA